MIDWTTPMRLSPSLFRKLLVQTALVLGAGLCAGTDVCAQGVTPESPTPLAKKLLQSRLTYKDAFDSWTRDADKSLEKDLHTKSKEELLKRIEAEAARTERFTSSQVDYIQAMHDSLAAQLLTFARTAVSSPQDAQNLNQQSKAYVLDQREQVEKELATTTDFGVKQTLYKSREILQAMQDNLMKQDLQIGQINDADKKAKAAEEALTKDFQNLVELLGAAQVRAAQKKEHYKEYFAEMRTEVLTSRVPPKQPEPPTQQPQRGTPPSSVPSIAGKWFCPPSETPEKLSGVAVGALNLTITESEDTLQGEVFAAFQVDAGVDFPAQASFRFSG